MWHQYFKYSRVLLEWLNPLPSPLNGRGPMNVYAPNACNALFFFLLASHAIYFGQIHTQKYNSLYYNP